jgi:hypothetical protein
VIYVEFIFTMALDVIFDGILLYYKISQYEKMAVCTDKNKI